MAGAVVPGEDISFNGHIASGQGFFVAMVHEAPVVGSPIPTVSQGELRFTNAMRRTTNNNLFFRDELSNEHNKLWLNLIGDDGLFNQTLVAYMPNASRDDDGSLYDARHGHNPSYPALIYSTINDSDDMFIIQSRSEFDLDISEQIPLGFKSDLEASFLFSISIGNLEGPFMTTEPVYLYDSYESVLHNLKESSYSFFSEPGEFNDRFSIVFSEAVLSQEDLSLSENTLTIRSKDNRISFSIGGNAPITRIELYDLLGRKLGDYLSNDFSVTLEVPQLKNATFIARVTLENGLVLLKKAFKR
jgi:hypothetical protein